MTFAEFLRCSCVNYYIACAIIYNILCLCLRNYFVGYFFIGTIFKSGFCTVVIVYIIIIITSTKTKQRKCYGKHYYQSFFHDISPLIITAKYKLNTNYSLPSSIALTEGAFFVNFFIVTSSILLLAAVRCFSDVSNALLIFSSWSIVLSIPFIAS